MIFHIGARRNDTLISNKKKKEKKDIYIYLISRISNLVCRWCALRAQQGAFGCVLRSSSVCDRLSETGLTSVDRKTKTAVSD